ncbi:hypothetical protein B0H67DRAFT_392435 [Lasiosphaeris hirsuta]|uniref:Uncharacterized protein n=1 Tax=Lasiosphaeris hirsuta TaxID=260670 RepID=A0AA40DGN2_9PEZI|nr:hypothetical protein B0H67DRAFT_392435 [Lasiosphaeris hirsuta]
MLVAIIKHGGDDDGQLTRRLLFDESNVKQAYCFAGWGLQQHLCCRYGRLK